MKKLGLVEFGNTFGIFFCDVFFVGWVELGYLFFEISMKATTGSWEFRAPKIQPL